LGRTTLAAFGKFWKSVKRRPSARLDIILDDADIPDLSNSGMFIASGLRAARGAQTTLRRTILNDVANVLQCSPDELGFLFMDPVMAANDSDPVMMPDFRATLQTESRVAVR